VWGAELHNDEEPPDPAEEAGVAQALLAVQQAHGAPRSPSKIALGSRKPQTRAKLLRGEFCQSGDLHLLVVFDKIKRLWLKKGQE